MCLAIAYKGGEESEPVLQEVAHVRLEDDRVELQSLFGEKKVIEGRIREIDFMNSKLFIE